MAKPNKQATVPKEARQAKVIKKLKKEENWLKWGMLAALLVILLLLLFIGYATDWTRGFKTASTDTPLTTNLDSAKTGANAPTNGTGTTGGSGTSGSGGAGGGSGTSGTNGTNGTGGGGTTSTTNNSSTTTNNSTTTTTPPPTPPTNAFDVLQDIYNSTGVGSNLQEVIDRATAAGITVVCDENLLLETCTLSVGDYQVVIRGLLSTGLITSIINL